MHISRAACVAALVLAAGLTGQGSWNFQSSPTNPFANSPAMAFDTTRNVTVLAVNGPVDTETYEWNGTFWLPHLPANKPFPRTKSAMTYDASDQRSVLFAGLGSNGTFAFRDTWEWNGSDWTLISQNQGPLHRGDHAMAYDAASQTTVLFGGYDPSNAGYVLYADTWKYDGTSWQQLSPVTSPAPRHGHGMCYDAARNRIVLFGGRTSSSYYGDTWEWDGTNWFQKFPFNSPSPRSGAGMVYDSTRGVTILFGGDDGGALPVGDTWEWDGIDWQRVTPASIPATRHDVGMAFDSSRDTTVLFGGTNGAYLRDTWEYVAGAFSSFTTYGAGCVGSMGTPSLATPFGQVPVPGSTFTVQVNNVSPTAQIWMFTGASSSSWGSTSLPFNLGSINAPGCSVLASGDFVTPVANVVGVGVWTITVPSGMAGVTFFNQAFVTDSSNALGLVASDGACIVVGT